MTLDDWIKVYWAAMNDRCAYELRLAETLLDTDVERFLVEIGKSTKRFADTVWLARTLVVLKPDEQTPDYY